MLKDFELAQRNQTDIESSNLIIEESERRNWITEISQ